MSHSIKEGWNWPKSTVPAEGTVDMAEELLAVSKGHFEPIGRAVRKQLKGILSGLIAESAIYGIPAKTADHRHRVMMLASIITQYELNQ